MKYIISLAAVLLSFSIAEASTRFEITCSFKDCSKSGWDAQIWGSSVRSSTTCKNGDCFMNGYNTSDDMGTMIETNCNQGGCWTAGWSTTISTTNPPRTITESATCKDNDCLRNGWLVTTSLRGFRETSCHNYDCAGQGWTTWGDGRTVYTGCKMGKCFEDGWITDVP
jgi:hypothetical protein